MLLLMNTTNIEAVRTSASTSANAARRDGTGLVAAVKDATKTFVLLAGHAPNEVDAEELAFWTRVGLND